MENNVAQIENVNNHSMKWHKFLTYFSLWAGAVLNVIAAFTRFTGSMYGSSGEADMVYSYFKGLKTIDVLFGVVMIAIAIFSIVTRFALAGYKAAGPKMLMGLYIIDAAVSIVYLVVASMVTGIALGELIDSSTISSLVTGIAMVFVNKAYYGKRAELFIN